MVDDVAQFSVRGGIFDIYGFGMTDPVRLEFWGDEIVDLRHFDLELAALDARRRTSRSSCRWTDSVQRRTTARPSASRSRRSCRPTRCS